MSQQASKPKLSMLQRMRCFCGIHSWENVESIQCAMDVGGIYEDLYFWRKCKHCGKEEDERCDCCKQFGTQACIDSWDNVLRTKKDLCCCKCDCHKHS